MALSEKLDLERMEKVPTKGEVVRELEGKVVEWGKLEYTYETSI